MLDLRDLIIERIQQAAALNQDIHRKLAEIDNPPTLDAELRVNRTVLKFLSRARNQQKARTHLEEQLLDEIKSLQFWHTLVQENFLSVSLAILSSHNAAFLSLLENSDPIAANLQKLYEYFAEKQADKLRGRTVPNLAEGNIFNTSPSLLLRLLSEWSRIVFAENQQRALSDEFDRHQQQMKIIASHRNNSINSKQKLLHPLSMSTQIQRPNDSLASAILTNKESVFGLFLDELTQYYRSMPLDLDYTFIKNIRKCHGKGNEFERQEFLNKAADILIEAKNKAIKEQIQGFRQSYLEKHPQPQQPSNQITKKVSSHSPQKEPPIKKTSILKSHALERIKSQTKDEEYLEQRLLAFSDRNSVLLCRKYREVSFDNPSELFLKKLKPAKQKKQLQLPELVNYKLLAGHSKSTAARTKPVHLIHSAHNVGFEDSGRQVSPKSYEFKQPYMVDNVIRSGHAKGRDMRVERENPERGNRREGEQLRRNRKLMLQLLRQKNRNSLFE